MTAMRESAPQDAHFDELAQLKKNHHINSKTDDKMSICSDDCEETIKATFKKRP